MAFVHGSNAALTLDGQTLTGYVDNVSLNKDTDLAEVTAFGNNDKEFIAGLLSGGLQISGHYDATQDGYLYGMFDSAEVAIVFSADGGTTSYSGNGFLSTYQIGAPVGDKVSWSATVVVNGTLTRA